MDNKLAVSSSFLPTGYVPPVDNKYMKWQQGENRFRIMSSPILGYEWWTDGEDGARKPNRIPMGGQVPSDQNPEEIRHFWAMIVWNYQDKRIQILEITQRGIQKTLYAIARDEEWGTPVDKYDISVVRSGTTKEDTRYEVVPKPPKPTDLAITEEFKNTPISLTALFEGKDPFVQKIEIVDEDKLEDIAKEVDEALQEEQVKPEPIRPKYNYSTPTSKKRY